jgi:hypothetical protein
LGSVAQTETPDAEALGQKPMSLFVPLWEVKDHLAVRIAKVILAREAAQGSK